MKAATILLTLPLLLLGCSNRQHLVVDHQATPGVAVSEHASYYLAVAPPEDADRMHWMIEKAIHDDLRSKGYVPVDQNTASLLVDYELEIDQEYADRQDATNAAPPPSGDAEKTLSVTITEVDNDQVIWRGDSAAKTPPSRVTSTLMTAVERIMDGVPASDRATASVSTAPAAD